MLSVKFLIHSRNSVRNSNTFSCIRGQGNTLFSTYIEFYSLNSWASTFSPDLWTRPTMEMPSVVHDGCWSYWWSLWCSLTMYLQALGVIFIAANGQGRNFNFRVWFEHFKIVNCFRTSSPGIWRTDILWLYTSANHVHYAVWSFNVKYGILDIKIVNERLNKFIWDHFWGID